MMSRSNRILPVLMALTVSIFLVACEADEEDELGTTEGLEQTPTTPDPGVGMQPGTGNFTTWDTDANRDLSEEEFRSGTRQGTWWTGWDTDANTTLSEEEFGTAFGQEDWYEEGAFDEWDTNGDGEISREEWQSGVFQAMDENNDGRIQEEEFRQGLFQGTM